MADYTKFKKIFSVFKSAQKKEEESAILNFYHQAISSSLDQITPIVGVYAAAGFRVQKSHSKILGQDPFNYLLENIYLDKHDEYRFKDKNNFVLEKIWQEAFAPEYKQEVIKKQSHMIEFLKRLEDKEHTGTIVERVFNEVFKGAPNLTFYINNVLNPSIIKAVPIFQETINRSLLYFKNYPTIHPLEISGLTNLSNTIAKSEVKYDQKKLFEIFKNEKVVKDIKEITVEQKNLNNMIKTLKLYENQFGDSDQYQKVIFNEILTQLTELNNNKHIENYPEASAKIGSLVHKHLPDLLSEFFEIPEKFRNTYKDNHGITPKQTFDEAITGISNNVKELMEEVYNHNFTNIKVKNRFIKVK